MTAQYNPTLCYDCTLIFAFERISFLETLNIMVWVRINIIPKDCRGIPWGGEQIVKFLGTLPCCLAAKLHVGFSSPSKFVNRSVLTFLATVSQKFAPGLTVLWASSSCSICFLSHSLYAGSSSFSLSCAWLLSSQSATWLVHFPPSLFSSFSPSFELDVFFWPHPWNISSEVLSTLHASLIRSVANCAEALGGRRGLAFVSNFDLGFALDSVRFIRFVLLDCRRENNWN